MKPVIGGPGQFRVFRSAKLPQEGRNGCRAIAAPLPMTITLATTIALCNRPQRITSVSATRALSASEFGQ